MRILVLFNLKPGVLVADYEAWSKSRDIPAMRSLMSINDYRVFGVTGLFGSDGKAPFQYAEVVDVADVDGFMKDIAQPVIAELMEDFKQWADAPVMLTTEELLLLAD